MTEENLIELIADLKVKNFKLQQRIDKAIEYIKQYDLFDREYDDLIAKKELLSILKGSDNNE